MRTLHTFSNGNKFLTASSKHYLKCTVPPCNCSTSNSRRQTRGRKLIFNWSQVLYIQANPINLLISLQKPISHFLSFSLHNSEFHSISDTRVSAALEVNVERLGGEVTINLAGEETTGLANLRMLRQKSVVLGIKWDDSCKPGQYTHLVCPKCKGGQTMERSLSFHINVDGDFIMWRCFRVTCGWAGQTFADNRAKYNRANQISKSKFPRQLSEEGLGLEPLGHELIAYFAGRMISEETLRRNAVMQISGDQDVSSRKIFGRGHEHDGLYYIGDPPDRPNVIAFTYRQNGVLVGCKYRTTEKKKFWQEKGSEKLLYGLDDIKEAAEIIIVEGELDKLSIEEAGFRNCVSVPGGAPHKVSTKELPSLEKDTAYQYLWNSKEYLDKASRIILATDGDEPGRALAEELARRLGRERCWQVSWPKKDKPGCFKDANEVLVALGVDSLKEVIENAELYEVLGQ